MSKKYHRTSVTRGRSHYSAMFDLVNGGTRAMGHLFLGLDLERAFNVQVRSNHIAVDTGTGSGVKVRFRVEERH